jgi:hypothetical protein
MGTRGKAKWIGTIRKWSHMEIGQMDRLIWELKRTALLRIDNNVAPHRGNNRIGCLLFPLRLFLSTEEAVITTIRPGMHSRFCLCLIAVITEMQDASLTFGSAILRFWSYSFCAICTLLDLCVKPQSHWQTTVTPSSSADEFVGLSSS